MSDSSSTKPWPLYILLACSLTLNVVMVMGRSTPEEPVETALVEHGDEELGEVSDEDSTDDAAKVEPGTPASVEEAAAAAPAGDWSSLHADVQSSLARTFQIAAGEDGDALASVFTRLFVWDIDMRRDLQGGDAVAVVWRKGADGFPEIAAGSLKTSKLGRTVTAYRWQAPGDAFPSYWHPDGTEAPLRLKDGPIEKYEQITSLLKDRPTHKGMDFKTPVGTEVTSPRAGTVTRVNWNWTYNGNCIEVRFDDGILAKFLHLSENKVQEGAKVSAGQLIALTGNTGHSTAPHLHYQLDRGDKTVDPLDYHGTVRRSLDAAQVTAMKRDVASYEGLLVQGAAQ